MSNHEAVINDVFNPAVLRSQLVNMVCYYGNSIAARQNNCLNVLHVPPELSIQSTSYLASVLMRLKGHVVLNVLQFGDVTHTLLIKYE